MEHNGLENALAIAILVGIREKVSGTCFGYACRQRCTVTDREMPLEKKRK